MFLHCDFNILGTFLKKKKSHVFFRWHVENKTFSLSKCHHHPGRVKSNYTLYKNTHTSLCVWWMWQINSPLISFTQSSVSGAPEAAERWSEETTRGCSIVYCQHILTLLQSCLCVSICRWCVCVKTTAAVKAAWNLQALLLHTHTINWGSLWVLLVDDLILCMVTSSPKSCCCYSLERSLVVIVLIWVSC